MHNRSRLTKTAADNTSHLTGVARLEKREKHGEQEFYKKDKKETEKVEKVAGWFSGTVVITGESQHSAGAADLSGLSLVEQERAG